MAGLLVAIGAGLALAQTAKTATHKMLTPDQLQWGKPPPGLPPSAELAPLEGDPSQPGWFIVRMRMPDGTQIRPHWHSKDEHITVLSGRMGMGMGDTWSTAQMKELPSGSYFSLPAGQKHFAAAHGETIVEISGPGPFDIHYVNPSDDPRNKRSSR
jgi:quercetin dioxygenase-like cupin family protein